MAFAPMLSARNAGTDVSANDEDCTTNISEARKNKLQAILKREKLKEVLHCKYTELYSGNISPGDDVNRFCKGAQMTQKNLKRLDDLMRHKNRLYKKGNAMSVSSWGSRKGSKAVSISEFSMMSGMSKLRMKPKRTALDIIQEDRVHVEVEDNEVDVAAPVKAAKPNMYTAEAMTWNDIAAYTKNIANEEAFGREIKKVQARNELCECLAQQISDRENEAKKLVDEDAKYYEYMITEQGIAAAQEKQKLAEHKAKSDQQSRDRAAQMEFCKKRDADATEKTRLEDEEQVRQILKQTQEAEAARLAKIMQDKAVMEATKMQNEADQAEKHQAEAERVAADLEQQKQNLIMAEQQDLARKAAMEARAEKQKKLMAKMQQTVGKASEEKAAIDEERALKQRQESDSRALELQFNKEAKLAAMNAECKECLFQQIRAKDEKKRDAQQLNMMMAHVMKTDQDAYNNAQKAKDATSGHKYEIYRDELMAQINFKAAQKKAEKVEMSTEEFLFNKGLLEQVAQNLKEHDTNCDGVLDAGDMDTKFGYDIDGDDKS